MIKKFIFLLFILAHTIGCTQQIENTKNEIKNTFNGLYNVEYLSDNQQDEIKYVWILTGKVMYILYPGSRLSVNYEYPARYYIKNNKFYICGINSDMNEEIIKKCENEKIKPMYDIIKIDTIIDSYSKTQRILLQDINSKRLIKLKKYYY